MKQIVIREAYDWILSDKNQPNGLTQVEWDQLVHFLEEEYNHENVVDYSNHKLRFINLVGVIQLKTVRIEVLPKVDLDGEDETLNRRSLLNMLSYTKKLPVELTDKTLSQYEKVDLLHILASLYISELTQTLHRGIYREYRLLAENSPTLKGRLLVSEHIRKNVQRTVNVFCEFDELTPNILVNQIVKAAVKVIFPYIHHSSLKIKLMNVLELLEDVEDVIVEKSWLDQIDLNRQNKHYERTLPLAKAILQSTSMSSGHFQETAFGFLFKMNDLFEEYIAEILTRMMSGSSYVVKTQHTEKRLLQNVISGKEDFLLKPDLVIETKQEEVKVILDTKWKSAFVNYRRNYKQGDIYQMYAYITTYQTAERCILLYPRTDEEGTMPKWMVPGSNPEKYIEVQTVRLGKMKHTIEDLEWIITNCGVFLINE